jgi:hypothetical protein
MLTLLQRLAKEPLSSILTQICAFLEFDSVASEKLTTQANKFFGDNFFFTTKALLMCATDELLKSAGLMILWPFIKDLQDKTGIAPLKTKASAAYLLRSAGPSPSPGPNPMPSPMSIPSPSQMASPKPIPTPPTLAKQTTQSSKMFKDRWIELGNVEDSIIIHDKKFDCNLCNRTLMLRSKADLERHSNSAAHQALVVSRAKAKSTSKKETHTAFVGLDESKRPKKSAKLATSLDDFIDYDDIVDDDEEDVSDNEAEEDANDNEAEEECNEEEADEVVLFSQEETTLPVILGRHVLNADGFARFDVPEDATISYFVKDSNDAITCVPITQLLKSFPAILNEITLFDIRANVPQEVECIVRKRGKGRAVEYLVKWRGYPEVCNTWQKATDLGERKDELLAEFNE